MITDAFRQGLIAFEMGKDINQCPYSWSIERDADKNSMYSQWVDGWNEAYTSFQDRDY